MEMCRQYKYVLYEISKQEMFHLARASNILVALGKINYIFVAYYTSCTMIINWYRGDSKLKDSSHSKYLCR